MLCLNIPHLKDFIEGDFHYPHDYHRRGGRVRGVGEYGGRSCRPQKGRMPRDLNARNVFDRIRQIVRVHGDSIGLEFTDGSIVVVDTSKKKPPAGMLRVDVVATGPPVTRSWRSSTVFGVYEARRLRQDAAGDDRRG